LTDHPANETVIVVPQSDINDDAKGLLLD